MGGCSRFCFCGFVYAPADYKWVSRDIRFQIPETRPPNSGALSRIFHALLACGTGFQEVSGSRISIDIIRSLLLAPKKQTILSSPEVCPLRVHTFTNPSYCCCCCLARLHLLQYPHSYNAYLIMPYDPDDDLYTAEPKLLSTHFSYFSVFFPAPVPPPNYDTIMSNASYHRVPENDMSRVSMSSEPADFDEALLLIDPLRNESNNGDERSPKHKFVCHPTTFTRLIAIVLFIPAFVLLIVANRRRNLSAIIFVGIAIARNVLVLLHHVLSRHIRIRIEFRRLHSTGSGRKPSRTCPNWLKPSPFHLLVDLVLVVMLLITTIIATQGSYGYSRGWYGRDLGNLVVPGVILSYIGM